MTRVRAIGMILAAIGGLLLLAVLIGLVFHQPIFGEGLTMRSMSRGGLIAIVGFAVLVSGLRIMNNSGSQ